MTDLTKTQFRHNVETSKAEFNYILLGVFFFFFFGGRRLPLFPGCVGCTRAFQSSVSRLLLVRSESPEVGFGTFGLERIPVGASVKEVDAL